MILWEGATFVAAVLILSAGLVYLSIRNFKRRKALEAFFASITHELKTPLASLRLQGEVLSEKYQDDAIIKRLVEDSLKLENCFDKILELSKLERGKKIVLDKIHPYFIFQRHQSGWGVEVDYPDGNDQGKLVLADTLALELIVRNLFENTIRHSGSRKVRLRASQGDGFYIIEYKDGGIYKKDEQKLSKLFYKDSKKAGSGTGLYLVKRLMESMGGDLSISKNKKHELCFKLKFKKALKEIKA